MRRLLAPLLERLNTAYRDRPYFVGLKARLLVAIALLLLVFVPFNIAKNLWIQPPVLVPRLALNLVVWIVSAACLGMVLRGRVERAGNGLALAIVLSLH